MFKSQIPFPGVYITFIRIIKASGIDEESQTHVVNGYHRLHFCSINKSIVISFWLYGGLTVEKNEVGVDNM